MSSHLLTIQKLDLENCQVPGYFVISTAPINVEDQSRINSQTDPEILIQQITQHLKDHEEDAEVLVMIHGYNTGQSGAEWWYKTTCEYISQHYQKAPKGLLIVGYRWSSEKIAEDEPGSFKDKIKSTQQALPRLLGLISRLGIIGIIVGLIGTIAGIFTALSLTSGVEILLAFVILLILSLIAVSPILTIVALRLTVYFRDTFRAANYGVSDLVEFIRQLDQALVQNVGNDDRQTQPNHRHQRRIRLSFIGLSMGAFVVTNAVRILSDVFDPGSIGNLGIDNRNKCPSSEIGNAFCLGKLVLVAPDIPAEAIVSGRANTLRSSLRRFQEAYLFCNEGDMALKLASTSANYFSFPAKTRDGGYRLGNVMVRNRLAHNNKTRQATAQSIVNQSEDGQLINATGLDFLDYLFIREQKPLSERQVQVGLEENQNSIAELFTYFDCTNYQEKYRDPKTGQEKEVGIVSHALNKPFLSFGDYVSLSLDFFAGKIDTHGGYIFSSQNRPQPELSKRLIYGLSCLGFDGFLATLKTDALFEQSLAKVVASHPNLTALQQEKMALLQIFSHLCGDRGMQVLLAPERYHVDVMGEIRDRNGY
ncbi:MAG: hypothetical protein LH660_14995 [Phormidesmis sp. CAN_BIN36]|nr:hypothetical protein [Phormidesmis sp. CAN_BIN36]